MDTKRVLIIGLGALVLLLVMGGVAMYYWMGKAMFEPGSVASRLPGEFDPPREQPTDGSYWQITRDIKLFHFSVGSGEDVLVVHGGPGLPPTKAWEAFKALGDFTRLHFYHQRGCGRSTKPIDKPTEQSFYKNIVAVENSLGLGAQIADIERIRRSLGQDKLVLIGHSFGALIASLYASEFPEHVKSLVFVSPADLVEFPKKGDDLFQIVGRRLPSNLKVEYEKYLHDYFDFKELFTKDEASLSEFFGRFAKFYFAATNEIGQVVRNEHTAGGGWMPLGLYMSLGKRHDFSSALAKINVPVLVIHGSNDMIPASDSRHFAGYFRNAKFVEINGAGHFPFEDKPQEFSGVVKDFLGEVKQARL